MSLPLVALETHEPDAVANTVVGDNNATVGEQIAVIIANGKHQEWNPFQNSVKGVRDNWTIHLSTCVLISSINSLSSRSLA
jgi:hypothetical protein